MCITDDSPLSEVVDAMESHLRKQRNVLVDRRAFYARVQEEGDAKTLKSFCAIQRNSQRFVTFARISTIRVCVIRSCAACEMKRS